jgi:hypothetical protein
MLTLQLRIDLALTSQEPLPGIVLDLVKAL